MDKKVVQFEDCEIRNDIAKNLTILKNADGGLMMSGVNAHMITRFTKSLLEGTAAMLGDHSHPTIPVAIKFYGQDGEFLALSTVQFIPNATTPEDMSAGQWTYTWSFYEEDLPQDATILELKNCLAYYEKFIISHKLKSSTKSVNYKSANGAIISASCAEVAYIYILKHIKNWLEENVGVELVLPEYFKAIAEKDGDEIVCSLIPAGEMKVLVKNDKKIQG